jgi:predicted O-methyltransferase YrrM
VSPGPVLARMRPIEGWFKVAEAKLLIATCATALAEFPRVRALVEVGSYCGRSTVVLGGVLQLLRPRGRGTLYAIDPHEGRFTMVDQGLQTVAPTFEKFRRNIADAGLGGWVKAVRKLSFETKWRQPICCLFIDGLHDYASVSRDFHHFEPWLAPGAYAAFHDYARYYPGVKTFVDELLQTGRYEKIARALTLIVLRKAEAKRPKAER